MAERVEQVRNRLREALQQRPGLSTRELQDVAREEDPGIGDLSLRQFNAKYVLPLKRGSRADGAGKRGGGARDGARPRAGAGSRAARAPGETEHAGRQRSTARDHVRVVLLDFARDLSRAESRAELVDVLSGLDRYAERILQGRD